MRIKKCSRIFVKASCLEADIRYGRLLKLTKADTRNVPAHIPIVYVFSDESFNLVNSHSITKGNSLKK